MAVLVIADHDNTFLKSNTHKTVTAALLMSPDVDLLVAGKNVKDVAEGAARIAGIRKVLLSDSDALGHGLAEAMTSVIVPLMSCYEAMLTPATLQGKNFSPRVAAKLDVAHISEIVRIVNDSTFVRTIYAGNAFETIQSSDDKKVITVRPTSFEAAPEGGAAPIESIGAGEGAPGTKFIEQQLVNLSRPDLLGANVVVSGGRALGSADEFRRVIEPLADQLGAAIGASRAAVDAGYAPNDYQVGQTGKVVAPELYIAIGISGAIQHLAGMKDSKVIVAINNDEDAPIFQVADYGLVEDYKSAVPELLNALMDQAH